MDFDYNSQRRNLRLPEYGRHIQKMVQYVQSIDNRDKRNEQAKAVISVMGNLNPHLRDVQDFRHKLWDHLYLIADFELDIDSPYTVPTPQTFEEKPHTVPYINTRVRALHYGRNIENMVNAIADRRDDAEKKELVANMANYMKKQYLMWNKDTVSDAVIFKDMAELSGGRIQVDPASLKLQDMQSELLRQPVVSSNVYHLHKKKKKKKPQR